MRTVSILTLLSSLLSLVSMSPAHAGGTWSGGPLPGDTSPAISAGSQMNPAIARGATNSLVVWEDNRASQGGFVRPPNGIHPNRDIYAARLDANGNLIDAVPIVVNDDAFDQLTPRVAWNGENYLVVWRSSHATQFYVTDGIYAARVSPAGVVLDNPAIVIEDGDDYDERDPIVASDGTNWAVFYNDYTTGALAERLDGALVHPQGFVMQKQVVLPSTQGQQQVNCDVAFAQDRYLIVYEKGYQGAFGRMVDTSLNPLASELGFQAVANKPECASNGSGFFVSFSGVRGTPVALDGTIAIPGGATYLGSGTFYGPETDCAWDGANWALAFSDLGFGTSPGHLYVSRVTPAGALVPGSPATVVTADSVREFAIGNGTGHSQAVWNDWSHSVPTVGLDLDDLYAARVSSAGNVTAPVFVSTSAPTQISPEVAGSAATGYLVAYLSQDSGITRVQAQRVAANGVAIDQQPIVLHTGTRSIRRLDTAFDGSEWLVVWDDWFGTLRHTFGMRVRADGTVLDPAPLNLLRGERPSVAALAGARTFLLVSWDHNQSNEYIRATRVDGASGVALDAPYLTLSIGSGFPDVLGFDDRWLVVFGGVRGVFVDAAGGVGVPFYAGQGQSETVHGLARAGDLAVIAFQTTTSTNANSNIHARRIMKDGTFLDPEQGVPVCQAENRQFDPRAAFDGTDFRITWTDYSVHPTLVPGIGDVRTARFTTNGTVPSVCGEALLADVRIPEGDAEIVAGAGIALVVVCTLHSEPPYGGLRIEVRSDGELPPIGVGFCAGDGSAAACPCANNGAAGHGCANSVQSSGALLGASGVASVALDSLVLHGSAMPNTTVTMYLQGTVKILGGQGTVFGDGLRCVTGQVIRLGLETNVGGASSYGGPEGDIPISVRGNLPASGGTRYYQAWYRNAASFCTSSTFNLSNGLEIVWLP